MRFKGPEESTYPIRSGYTMLTAQRRLPAGIGRSTSSFPTSIRTRARVLASLTGSFTQISMSCMVKMHLLNALLTFDSSGSVCLDVINQTWSPMYDMINIFEVFLPQLLRYPNPSDPLNGEAAAMLMREPKTYEAKVKGTSPPMPSAVALTVDRIRRQVCQQRCGRRCWGRHRV